MSPSRSERMSEVGERTTRTRVKELTLPALHDLEISKSPLRLGGVYLVPLVERTPDGLLVVDGTALGLAARLVCRAIQTASPPLPGSSVAVMFEGSDTARPIVLGAIGTTPSTTTPAIDVRVDGEQVVLEARQSIELRCGAASLTLLADGAIVIRGEYVLSRASGVNAVQGATVQIN
jgi:hypothetical protein